MRNTNLLFSRFNLTKFEASVTRRLGDSAPLRSQPEDNVRAPPLNVPSCSICGRRGLSTIVLLELFFAAVWLPTRALTTELGAEERRCALHRCGCRAAEYLKYYLLTQAQLDARWDQPSKRWYTFRALELARRRCPQWRPYHE